MPVAAMGASMGGNVRVGLEDSLWIGPGRLAPSNADQVTQAERSSKDSDWTSPPRMRRARSWN
jgi:uncharacterized protein (DUF849 family)